MRVPRSSALPVLSLVLAWCGAAHAGSDAEISAAAPPAATITQVSSSGLTLDIPKWQRHGSGPNKQLLVVYKWGTQSEWRSALVNPAGGSWIVRFPDQLEAGTTADLKLTYVFELSAEAKTTINSTALSAADTVVQIIIDSTTAAGTLDAEEFEQFFKEKLEPLLTNLKNFTDQDGGSARAVLLRALQLEPKDPKAPEGPWRLRGDGLLAAAGTEAERLQLSTISKAREQRLSALEKVQDSLDDACRSTVQQASTTSDIASSLALIDQCVASLKARAPELRAAIDYNHDADGILKKLFGTADQLAIASKQYAAAALVPADISTGYSDRLNDIGQIAQALSNEANAAPKLQPYLLALRLAADQIARAKLTLASSTRVALLVNDIVQEQVTLLQTHTSNSLLEIDAARRYYDVATGLVYVVGLSDWVLPTLISVCPAGCLKLDKGQSDYLWTGHTLSIDVGVKTATVDAHVDPRHDGALGMLLGGSWNPVDVLRVSAGIYTFENRQSQAWNFTMYTGFTLNVLHAGELLGVFGMGELPQPKIDVKPK